MDRALQLRLLAELLTLVENGNAPDTAADSTVPVDTYTSVQRLADETRILFRQLPLIVGHSSELRQPGDFLLHDASGIPLLIVRQADGQARAFLNVCRHRGTKLVCAPHGQANSFVCRYHAWTYDLGGKLLRVPRRECFPTLQNEEAGLISVPLAERCGFLWAIPGKRGTALNIDAYLGPLAAELTSFDLDRHIVFRHVIERKHANWKLVIDAFLEGYHLRSLHRDTISRYFLDGLLLAAFPPHSRALGARKGLLGARSQPTDSWNLRELTTPFYQLFPNSILVFHPDWVTQLSVYPDGVDHLIYSHRMLIPRLPENEAEKAHWQKTFQLIESTVFQREDLEIAESIQAGFAANANTHFRLGQQEVAVKWFHDQIERHLTDSNAI